MTTDRNSLPSPPGDQQRAAPYTVCVRMQYASPAWRAVARPYYEAARAWRAELQGYDGYNNRRVVSFDAWKRLRDGKPSTFAAYDEARRKVLATPTDHARDLASKLQIAAEMLGIADPDRVAFGQPYHVPPEGWSEADLIFAALYRDARAVTRRVDARAKGGR